MPSRLYSVVIDAADPLALAEWWATALGWRIVNVNDASAEVEVDVADSDDGVFAISIVTVVDKKITKNRVHLDLASDTTEGQTRTVDRLVASGATRVEVGQGEQPGAVPWVVLADPEGNELCVLEPREQFEGRTLASIVIDCADPRKAATFWRAVLGWDLVSESDAGMTLSDPTGRRPDLDFIAVAEPKVVKDRIHLDVAPWAHEDQAAEVERVVALGATHVDIGQGSDRTWVVLSDPDGHEFCVLSSRDD